MSLIIIPQLFGLLTGLYLLGSLTLKILNIREMRGIQNITVSFWLGYFIYGILLFLVQIFSPITSTTMIILLCIGTPSFFIKSRMKNNYFRFDKGLFYGSLFLLAMALTFPKAMIPPVEDISLAREFALAKAFAESGTYKFPAFTHITDTPLHAHILSSVAYKFGGEKLMLLFNWWSIFMSGLAVYTLARRRIQGAQAWLLTSVIFSLPILSKTIGLGLPDLKLIGAYSLAAWALSIYSRNEHIKWLVVTSLFTALGLSLSFYGLFFAISITFCVFMAAKDFGWKHSIAHNITFAILTPLLGSIWFIWFTIQSTDITLTSLITQFFIEQDSRTWKDFFAYPYTLMMQEQESTFSYHAFGPLFLMLVAPAGVQFIRRFPFWDWSITVDTPTFMTTLSIIYFGLWFFFSPILEPITLLPIIPMLLLPVWEIANNIRAKSRIILRSCVILSVLTVLSLQMGLAVKINEQPISVFFRHETPTQYVNYYDPTAALSEHLQKKPQENDYTYVMHSQLPALNYHFGHYTIETPAIHTLNAKISDISVIPALNEIMQNNIAYWITKGNVNNPLEDSPENGHATLRALINYGCFYKQAEVKDISAYAFVKYCAGKPLSASIELVSLKAEEKEFTLSDIIKEKR